MGEKHANPAGQDDLPPAKRSRRVAGEQPEYSVGDLPKPTKQPKKQGSRSSGLNKKNVASNLLKQSGTVLRLEARALLGDVPGVSNKQLAHLLADRFLGGQEALELLSSAPAAADVPIHQETPTTVEAVAPVAQPLATQETSSASEANAPVAQPPAVQEDSSAVSQAQNAEVSAGQEIPSPGEAVAPVAQLPAIEEDPSAVAPTGMPDSPAPVSNLGAPKLTNKDINEGNADQNFQTLLHFWEDQAQKSTFKKEIREKKNQLLADDIVHRAIAALTESLDHEDRFAFTTQNAWSFANFYNPVGCQRELCRFVRPRKTIIHPYTYSATSLDEANEGEDGHHFLIKVQLESDSQSGDLLPRIHLYDSAPKYLEKTRANVIADVEQRIRNLHWFTWPGSAYPGHGFLPYQMIPVPHQKDGKGCGIYTILNGWCAALGLQPVAAQYFSAEKSFERSLRRLVNLALWGKLDARTIFSFVRCYGYIQPDDVLSSQFDRNPLRRFAPNENSENEEAFELTVAHYYDRMLQYEDAKLGRWTGEVDPADEDYQEKLDQEQHKQLPDEEQSEQSAQVQQATESQQHKQQSWQSEDTYTWKQFRIDLHNGELKVPWWVLGMLGDEELSSAVNGWQKFLDLKRKLEGNKDVVLTETAWHILYPDANP